MQIFSLFGGLVLGILCGLTINYLSDVLPHRRKITQPFCLRCLFPIPWRTYPLMVECQNCGQRRPVRYWIVAIATILMSIGLFMFPNCRLSFIQTVVLLIYFGVIIVIDLEYRLILNSLSIVGALIGLWVGIVLHGWVMTIIGGIAGFGAMYLLYLLGYIFAKVIGKARKKALDEDALGFGDVNLAGVIGLLLGWPGVIAGLGLAILLGGGVSLAILVNHLLRRKYKPFTPIAYGPFLVVAAAYLLLFVCK